jgi:hypothetical protein
VTELSSAVPAVTGSQWLAAAAVALLVFVSAGVVYLSAVEWRDRRRRRADARSSDSASSPAAGKRGGRTSTRSPAAFGRRP